MHCLVYKYTFCWVHLCNNGIANDRFLEMESMQPGNLHRPNKQTLFLLSPRQFGCHVLIVNI